MIVTPRTGAGRTISPNAVLFLSWGSPWPAHGGAALRSFGLLKELSKAFPVELVLLTRAPLSAEQHAVLAGLATTITRFPLKDVTLFDKVGAGSRIFSGGYPYHSAILLASLATQPAIRRRIEEFPGVVFTSTGHWGTLARKDSAPNWILNQCDADVELWRVYATQADNSFARLAARINYRFARRHYPSIYANVDRIISVCEEDRQHTLALAPQARVDVIENGVDCTYLTPDRSQRSLYDARPRLLFTGTSAGRNMTALRRFVRTVLPLIQRQIPDVELLVAGNFTSQAQSEFRSFPAMRFTGRVDDIRPYFNQSDVFVAPFEETHGSKLKIAEAMAMALPIVSTLQGVRGFDLVHERSALLASTEQEFATHCVSLLKSSDLRETLGQTARGLATQTRDWKVLGERLRVLVHDTFERRNDLLNRKPAE